VGKGVERKKEGGEGGKRGGKKKGKMGVPVFLPGNREVPVGWVQIRGDSKRSWRQ